MKKLFLLLLFLAANISALAADPAPAQPDFAFFTKLRLDYAQRPDFSPVWELEDYRQAVVEAFQAKDYKTAFDLSGKWLAKCPVDADVHILRSSAATALGDLKSYVHHLYFAYGLMQSITQSGDGLTAKTAFKVISVAEEYSLLRDFGAEVTEQALVDGPCDQMKCKMRNGTEVTFFFDVSVPMGAIAKERK
jgi:hypothetical protein